MFGFKDGIKIVKHSGDSNDQILWICFMKNVVYINDAKVDISDGDFIHRLLPNGNVERHIILDTGFKSGTGCDQDHFECQVRKLTAELPIKKYKTIYQINGDNSWV